MTDATSPTPPELPNSRSKERGIADLTQGRFPIHTASENGVWIVKYNTHARPHLLPLNANVSQLDPVSNANHLDAIKQTFKEIEGFANVKFVEVHDNSADIEIYLGTGMETNTGGYDVVLRKPDGSRKHAVILNPLWFENCFKHEIGHTLGLSHPEELSERRKILELKASAVAAGTHTEVSPFTLKIPGFFYSGKSPAYNKDGTVMHYDTGFIHNSYGYYGPYDIAVLQHYYGKPNNRNPHQFINTHTGLPSTIYSEKPVTIEIEKDSGIYCLRLPSIHAQGMVTITDGSRLAFDTQIADVIVNPDTITDKVLIGNELTNRLQGGGGNDWLAPEGNGDTLTGGAGKDRFALTNGTHNTVISDWASEDHIFAPPETVQLMVSEYKQADKTLGATLCAYDADNKLLSSAHLCDITVTNLLQHFKEVKGWEKYQTGPVLQLGSLSAAIAKLRSLDIGNNTNPLSQLPDGSISRIELGYIANNSDLSQIPHDLAENIIRRSRLQQACDLNNNGDTSKAELFFVCEQAKLAGIKFDSDELVTTLLTGNLPTIQNISGTKTAGK